MEKNLSRFLEIADQGIYSILSDVNSVWVVEMWYGKVWAYLKKNLQKFTGITNICTNTYLVYTHKKGVRYG